MPAATPPVAPGPLAGLRVVDCSTVLAGPYCTMLLADLGADVVKVEPPEGDSTRGWGPPWVGDAGAGTRTAAYFLAVNRNKRSHPARPAARGGGRGAATPAGARRRPRRELPDRRPRRLGFDDAELTRLNPALVHLAISGYGPDGPAADRPGYDFVIQAASGLMSITGAADADGGEPTKVGVAITDVVSGMLGAVSVLAALVGRERAGPGAAGQRVDVSLLGATLAFLRQPGPERVRPWRSTGPEGQRPSQHRAVRDLPDRRWRDRGGRRVRAAMAAICEAVGLAALAADRRFATNGDRVEHRDELRPILADRLANARRRPGWPRWTPRRSRPGRSATSSRRSPRRRRSRAA